MYESLSEGALANENGGEESSDRSLVEKNPRERWGRRYFVPLSQVWVDRRTASEGKKQQHLTRTIEPNAIFRSTLPVPENMHRGDVVIVG